MPGVVGIISREASPECEALLRGMMSSMQHESSYVGDSFSFPDLGIYAGWVAHPESFPTKHCGRSKEGDLAIVFSGEVYEDGSNLSETSPGDQSWLLARYREKGERFLEELNGLFSGLLIDLARKRAFLFNDRYGMERIYVHERAGTIYFASEAKAVLQAAPSTREFDPAGVAQYLAFGCTTSGRTLFRGISLLPGGSSWRFGAGEAAPRTRYFTAERWESQSELAPDEFDEEFSSSFRRVLPQYVNGDRAVGLSLTGGLDTRMIMACLPPGIAKPVCYTFANEGREMLDVALAAQIAQTRGLTHETLRIGSDFFNNFAAHLDRAVWITDGCAGAMTAHEIPLNRQAGELAPIRVTGNFGSEVLRAVSTFKRLALTPELLNPVWRHAVESAAQEAPNAAAHPVTFSAFREIPWNLFGTLAAARSQITFRTPFLDNAIVSLAYRAPMALRLSAIPALRLIHENDRLLSRIPTDRGEIFGSRGLPRMLRRGYAEVMCKLDYLHADGLPHALSRYDGLINSVNTRMPFLGQHKFLRYRSWFRKEIAPVVTRVLGDPQTQQLPFWNPAFISRLASDHIGGRKNYVREINAVLTLEAVNRLLIQTT